MESLISSLPRQRRIRSWEKAFIDQFVKSPGQHMLIVGITGSGKTQTLYWLGDLIAHNTDETIVWFDIGKNDEAFKLGEICERPMKVIVPAGCKIESKDYDFELIWVDPMDIGEVWNHVEEGFVNIISIYRFILDPHVFTQTIAEIFKSLIMKAHNYQIRTPMTIFADEFHNVAPSRNDALDYKQYLTGAWIQVNVEKLRSLGIRLIATTHGWRKIRAGIRSSFNWLIFKRISDDVGRDQKKLNKFTPLIQTLRNDQCIIVFPNKRFTDKAITPFYGDANKRVFYYGVYGET